MLLPHRIRGTFHAFYSIVNTSGFKGLWRGWIPNVQRAALVNMGGKFICYYCYYYHYLMIKISETSFTQR